MFSLDAPLCPCCRSNDANDRDDDGYCGFCAEARDAAPAAAPAAVRLPAVERALRVAFAARLDGAMLAARNDDALWHALCARKAKLPARDYAEGCAVSSAARCIPARMALAFLVEVAS